MAFLDDFANAVSGYPAASVTLSIVGVAVQTGTVGPINVNEVCRFQVRVNNNGHLNMTGVTLRVQGRNGATVSTVAAGPFGDEITTGAMNVNSHGSQDTINLFFKAPNTAKPVGTTLVVAIIRSFNVNLDHILNDHSQGSAQPSGAHTAQVFP